MSVLIKCMEMPKNCAHCFLTDFCNQEGFGIFSNNRNKPCPLVEVKTPHGRLIDADANVAVLNKVLEETESAYERLFYSFASAIMKECPTIIEAEEGADNG